MTVLRKSSRVGWVTAGAARSRALGLYERYGCWLFRQAMLSTGDEAAAEQVICDVIAGECALVPVPGHSEDQTRYRLAESALRRCQELAAAAAR